MKDEELEGLVRRIRQELEELQRVLGRIQEGWERSRRSNDDYYLDGVALNLHGFYLGFERIFTHIAETSWTISASFATLFAMYIPTALILHGSENLSKVLLKASRNSRLKYLPLPHFSNSSIVSLAGERTWLSANLNTPRSNLLITGDCFPTLRARNGTGNDTYNNGLAIIPTELQKELRRTMIKRQMPRLFKRVIVRSSHHESLIQVADLVAGAIMRRDTQNDADAFGMISRKIKRLELYRPY